MFAFLLWFIFNADSHSNDKVDAIHRPKHPAWKLLVNQARGPYWENTVFSRISRGWRLFKNWTLQRNLFCKIQRHIFHLYEKITVCNRSIISLPPFTSFGTFQWCLHPTQNSLLPSTTSLFRRKDISTAVLDFLYSSLKLYGIPQISAASGPLRLFEGGVY